MTRPSIVCLCGSTRFRAEFEQANRRFTLQGRIVLTVGFFAHGAEGADITDTAKHALDHLHLHKIRLADEVFIINPGGYIGESTRREIAYSIYLGKCLHFLDDRKGEAYLERETHSLGALMASFIDGPDELKRVPS